MFFKNKEWYVTEERKQRFKSALPFCMLIRIHFFLTAYYSYNSTSFNTTYSSALRFHCVGGCWDRTQDCCDIDALTTRLDLIHLKMPATQKIGHSALQIQNFINLEVRKRFQCIQIRIHIPRQNSEVRTLVRGCSYLMIKKKIFGILSPNFWNI